MKRRKEKRVIHPHSPARITAASFLIIIAAGTALLMLPAASKGAPLPFLTALFTSTSATCVTGLTLIDPYTQLTFFGQAVLLAMIELGGIGLVTLSSFFISAMRKRVSIRDLRLAQENTNAGSLVSTRALLKMIIGVMLSAEAVGALLFALRFIPKYGVSQGIWFSVFTSISSFCNAGFDLFGIDKPFSSAVGYNSDPYVLFVIMLLIVLGGMGFMVYQDLLAWRKNKRLMLHSKVVLTMTAILIAGGTAAFFICEYTNPATIGEMTFGDKLLNSLFQSVSARTAGYSSIDIAEMRDISKAVMILLMFVGAGSGSTGGGVKVTTFAVLAATVLSVIRNRSDTVIFGRRVDKKAVYKSLTIAALGIGIILLASAAILLAAPDSSAIDYLFEVFSAFGTVGVTAGVTGTLNTFSLLIITAVMFIGRIGPMCFALAISISGEKNSESVLPEGRIMVG